MCYPKGEFLIGDYDVKPGESGSRYEAWKHTNLVIDLAASGGRMFSLDNDRERRFLARSELCAVA